MPAGDPQRVWFSEMIEELRSTWSSAMTWDELADFCHRMMQKRRSIRLSRGIEPPRMRCPKCGNVSRSDIPGVSIRSALFAMKNNGIVTGAEFTKLDREWKKHKARHNLDAFGREKEKSRRDANGADPCC